MQQRGKIMGSQRYSTEFKQTAVEDLLAGAKRPSQICRERGIDFTTLRRWRQEYTAQGVAAWTEAGRRQTSSLEEKIAELERVVGQLTVENMVLKKALQQARSPLGCATPSSKS
jgi:transposase-like protein